MTVPRVQALQRHWMKYPPVHITAALFAGIKSEPAAAPSGAPARPISNAEVVREMSVRAQDVRWTNVVNG